MNQRKNNNYYSYVYHIPMPNFESKNFDTVVDIILTR